MIMAGHRSHNRASTISLCYEADLARDELTSAGEKNLSRSFLFLETTTYEKLTQIFESMLCRAESESFSGNSASNLGGAFLAGLLPDRSTDFSSRDGKCIFTDHHRNK